MFSTVVVGTDGSPTAAKAVRHAIELCVSFGAALHVVTVYKPKSVRAIGVPDEFWEQLGSSSEADALLADQCAQARVAGVAAEGHAETGDPADAIVGVADTVGADLVIVGNKGMTGLRRVLGSVPNSVAHQASCAVLIVQTS